MSIKVEVDGQPIGLRTIIFSGGEVQPRLIDLPMAAEVVTVTAHVWSAVELVEVLLVYDALRHVYPSTVPIDLICPYLPYARQDRVCHPGESFGLSVIAGLLAPFRRVEAWDVHSHVARSRMRNLHSRTAAEFVSKIPLDWASTVIVAPDKGAFPRAVGCAVLVECQMIAAEKTRDPDTGDLGAPTIPDAHVAALPPKPDFLIVDDICDGGRTFVNLAQVLRPLTNGKIYLYVTHGIFSAGWEHLSQAVDGVFVANIAPEAREELRQTRWLLRRYTPVILTDGAC